MTATARSLRNSMTKGKPLLVPGCGDAVSARLVELTGFPATCISGAWVAGTLGYVDVGIITLNEMVAAGKYISDSVGIPVLADADTGFGELINVARCVRDFEDAGLAGLQIEDQGYPKRCGLLPDKVLISGREMAEKVEAAVRARRNDDFIIIARTDALGPEGLESAIERGQLYFDAGADLLLIEAVHTEDELKRIGDAFVEEHLIFNRTPASFATPLPLDMVAECGFTLIYYPMQVVLTAVAAGRKVLEEIAATGSCESAEESMLSVNEFFGLLPSLPEVELAGIEKASPRGTVMAIGT